MLHALHEHESVARLFGLQIDARGEHVVFDVVPVGQRDGRVDPVASEVAGLDVLLVVLKRQYGRNHFE